MSLEDDLPALAELDEEQETPSARQRAQRRLPLNQRRAWSQVIEGQVLDVLAQEQGEVRHGGRLPNGRPRGLAALIPEAPVQTPARAAAPRTAPLVAPEPTPAPTSTPRPITEADLPRTAEKVIPDDLVAALAEQVLTGQPGDLTPPAPGSFHRPALDTGPLRAVFERLRPPPGWTRPPGGDASARERLAHRDTGWCTCDGLPAQHLLNLTTLDVHQLDHAERHGEVIARSGTVLLTRCGDISPRARMHASQAPPDRCPGCDTAPDPHTT